MTPDMITDHLTLRFSQMLQVIPPDSWQVDTDSMRLLVLLSADHQWLRILVPLMSAEEALPFFSQILEANFDHTQETRYALNQGVLWGVFQHGLTDLTPAAFESAIDRLLILKDEGMEDWFTALLETQMRQIIQAAKRQGQSLEATLQTLERFYEEGVMGNMQSGPEARQQVLAAWEYQLKRLWFAADDDLSL